MRYDSITEAIGNTPLVRIDPAVHGLRNIDLYAKLEMLNPFGSVKDRPAWHMARPHLEAATDAEGTVVELSSGNTAKALALLAGMHGVRFKSVTNRTARTTANVTSTAGPPSSLPTSSTRTPRPPVTDLCCTR